MPGCGRGERAVRAMRLLGPPQIRALRVCATVDNRVSQGGPRHLRGAPCPRGKPGKPWESSLTPLSEGPPQRPASQSSLA